MSTNEPAKTSQSSAASKALEKARGVSEALVDAARIARFSSAGRGGGAFSRRRSSALARAIFRISLFWMVAVPMVLATIYFGFVASGQYSSETRFTVQGGATPRLDGLSALTGLPSLQIIQNTQIVANYVHSRGIVEELEKRINLRTLYAPEKADFLARFNQDEPIERLVKYWKKMSKVEIEMPTGIVNVSVYAFNAEDAQLIANTVLELSEKLVNDMNQHIRQDNIQYAEREFRETTERLKTTRVELERVRNLEGMLDATETSKAINELITGLQGEKLKLQQEYETQRKLVQESAPQMRMLSDRMGAMDEQIARLKGMLTNTSASSASTLSGTLNLFAELNLKRDIAQKQYVIAATSLEIARAVGDRQLTYLSAFVRPSRAEDPSYPKRFLAIFISFAASLLTWGLFLGLLKTAKNNMG